MTTSSKTLVNVIAIESLIGKKLEDAYDLLEEMTVNVYQWPSDITLQRKHSEFMKWMCL